MKMERVFSIIPASSGAYTFLWIFSVVIGLILVGIIVMFALFGYQAGHTTFTVNDQGLRIGPGLYSRFIPKQEINADGVRVVNLNTETNYKPKWRTNGAGLPGYLAGWFKLQNNEKALLFVTDRSSVVYIPTTENYSVMLSVKDADEFVALLQNWK
jgi:hypothetical protein